MKNQTLCQEELHYITQRNVKTEISLKSLLYRNRIPNFDIETFWSIKTKPIQIALAISGGGYRSMLTGAGVILALDDRYPNSSLCLNGLLQSTSYIAGISGGSWLVMSNFINDFEPIHKLQNLIPEEWDLSELLLQGVPNFDTSDLQKTPLQQQQQQQQRNKYKSKKQGMFSSILDLFTSMKSTSTSSSSSSSSSSSGSSTGSSGGGWIGNLFNLPQEQSLTKSNQTTDGYGLIKKYLHFYKELLIEVRDKKKAGFHTSFTDYWGRALARRIFKSTARTPGATISAATHVLASFKEYDQPFPIIGTIEKDPSNPEFSTNFESHCFEFTPFEFGSWDSYLHAFIPIKYLGTSLKANVPTKKSTTANHSYCVSGFDNVGFITGTSSSLFNHVFFSVYKLLESYELDAVSLIETTLKSLGLSSEWKALKNPKLHADYALYSPNPFFQYGKKNTSIWESPDLYLVDGGDDGQNIPFHPFLNVARNVDIILAYDMSNERDNYPNGTVLARTSQRYKQTNNTNIEIPYFRLPDGITSKPIIKSIFPKVPTPKQFITYGLNKYPIFLGCDIVEDYETLEFSDMIPKKTQIRPQNYLPPLIVYHANNNYSYWSNTSTFQLSYNKTEVYGMINNGYNLATYMNSTVFSVCLNCAILKREFDRLSLQINPKWHDGKFNIPKICKKCYKTFCWRDN